MKLAHLKIGGFSLVELMVTLSILAVLLSAGIPAMIDWVANSRIRSSSESLLAGLQLARAEAIRRNANVRFLLIGTSGAWQVVSESVDGANQPQRCTFTGGTIIQEHVATTASKAITINLFSDIAATNASASMEYVFGPNGWRGCPNIAVFSVINIDSSALAASESRDLRIVVQPGGGSRMCDPNVSSTDTRACPA
jgi:type IV fimbrial biogenesis protein FimT